MGKALYYKVISNNTVVVVENSIANLCESLSKYLVNSMQIDGNIADKPVEIKITTEWIGDSNDN